MNEQLTNKTCILKRNMSLDFPASKVELAGSAGIFKYPAAEQIMEDGQCQQMLKDSAKARTNRGITAKYHAAVAAVEQVEKSDFGGSKTTVALNATGVTLDDRVTKATAAINGAANFGATAVHANLHATTVSGLDVAIFVPGDTAKVQKGNNNDGDEEWDPDVGFDGESTNGGADQQSEGEISIGSPSVRGKELTLSRVAATQTKRTVSAVSAVNDRATTTFKSGQQQIEETTPILDAVQQKIVNAPTAIFDRHEAALISGQQQLIEKSDPNNSQIIHTYGRKATTMSKLASNLSNTGQQQVTPAASPTNDRAPTSGQQQHTELCLPL
ncbi:hypothetical protein A4A49_35725 [Nicotiana attenuata]|uniref:Uncharacterized protein n=1 Tax=Nicotiana attenuata TaxID=49451 RepID=A0A1J6K0L2_NICAT|nr:hypothetical protein A4A49_35725 [Nicotiana attenuata]